MVENDQKTVFTNVERANEVLLQAIELIQNLWRDFQKQEAAGDSFFITKFLVRPIQKLPESAECCWRITVCCSPWVVSRSEHISWTCEACALYSDPQDCPVSISCSVVWPDSKGNTATRGTPGHSVAMVCFPSFSVLGNVLTERIVPKLLGLFGNTSIAFILLQFFIPTPSDHTEFPRVYFCSGQKQNLNFPFPLSQRQLVADRSA